MKKSIQTISTIDSYRQLVRAKVKSANFHVGSLSTLSHAQILLSYKKKLGSRFTLLNSDFIKSQKPLIQISLSLLYIISGECTMSSRGAGAPSHIFQNSTFAYNFFVNFAPPKYLPLPNGPFCFTMPPPPLFNFGI